MTTKQKKSELAIMNLLLAQRDVLRFMTKTISIYYVAYSHSRGSLQSLVLFFSF